MFGGGLVALDLGPSCLAPLRTQQLICSSVRPLRQRRALLMPQCAYRPAQRGPEARDERCCGESRSVRQGFARSRRHHAPHRVDPDRRPRAEPVACARAVTRARIGGRRRDVPGAPSPRGCVIVFPSGPPDGTRTPDPIDAVECDPRHVICSISAADSASPEEADLVRGGFDRHNNDSTRTDNVAP